MNNFQCATQGQSPAANYNPYANPVIQDSEIFDISAASSEETDEDFTRTEIPASHYYNRTAIILSIDILFYIIGLLAFLDLAQKYPAWYAVVAMLALGIVWASYSLNLVCSQRVYGRCNNGTLFWYHIFRATMFVAASFLTVLFFWLSFALSTGSGDEYNKHDLVIHNISAFYGILAAILAVILVYMGLTYRKLKYAIYRWAKYYGYNPL